MARPARFTDDDILDSALECVWSEGPHITIANIATQLGGPVGSIYHRFSSRETVLVRLWMRSIRRFQAGLFELAETVDAHEALVSMALHVPRYCREHPDEAASLTLYRHGRLIGDCPDDVRSEVAVLNDNLVDLLSSTTARRYPGAGRSAQEWVLMAVLVSPYGLVRPYLGSAIPLAVDDAVAASADAILRLGDSV